MSSFAPCFDFRHHITRSTVLSGEYCRLRLLGFRKRGSSLQGKDTGEATPFTGRPILQDHRAGAVFSKPTANPMRRY
jgi:hypothetical protein